MTLNIFGVHLQITRATSFALPIGALPIGAHVTFVSVRRNRANGQRESLVFTGRVVDCDATPDSWGDAYARVAYTEFAGATAIMWLNVADLTEL